ncbi:MAG: Gfo/Idh/MocA family protein [Lautropia sp.]
MTQRQLGVAVLGYAHSHGIHWAEAFRDDDRVDFVGTWDHDVKRGTTISERLAVPYHPDLDKLLSDPRVQAVAITSEHALHPEEIELAARHGHAILCEKPLAVSHDGVDRVAKAVADSGVRFMQAFHMRLDPAHQEARRLLQSGVVGTISSAKLRHSHDLGLIGWPGIGDESWYFDTARSGGGAGFDELIHAADWMRWALGEPVSVVAERSSLLHRGDVEDLIQAIFRLRSGALVSIESSWTATSGIVTHEILGLEGSLLQIRTDISANRSPDLIGSAILTRAADRNAEWQRSEVTGVMNAKPHHRAAREFVRCIVEDAPFSAGVDDGIAGVRMVLAAYQAADTGRRVELAESFAG